MSNVNMQEDVLPCMFISQSGKLSFGTKVNMFLSFCLYIPSLINDQLIRAFVEKGRL